MTDKQKAVGIGIVVRDRFVCQGVDRQMAEALSILAQSAAMEGIEWALSNLWKDAQGDDLPEIDREVIVIDKMGKVSFGHRPIDRYTGVSLTNHSEMEEYFPQRYDKGGWNFPDIVWWLDLDLPNMEDLA